MEEGGYEPQASSLEMLEGATRPLASHITLIILTLFCMHTSTLHPEHSIMILVVYLEGEEQENFPLRVGICRRNQLFFSSSGFVVVHGLRKKSEKCVLFRDFVNRNMNSDSVQGQCEKKRVYRYSCLQQHEIPMILLSKSLFVLCTSVWIITYFLLLLLFGL